MRVWGWIEECGGVGVCVGRHLKSLIDLITWDVLDIEVQVQQPFANANLTFPHRFVNANRSVTTIGMFPSMLWGYADPPSVVF